MGEEATETVIAAKNGDNDELKNEINDLLYHVMVLAANQGLEWSDVEKVLDEEKRKNRQSEEISSGRRTPDYVYPKALRSCAGLFCFMRGFSEI